MEFLELLEKTIESLFLIKGGIKRELLVPFVRTTFNRFGNGAGNDSNVFRPIMTAFILVESLTLLVVSLKNFISARHFQGIFPAEPIAQFVACAPTIILNGIYVKLIGQSLFIFYKFISERTIEQLPHHFFSIF
jgi:hypothetical protein